MDKPYERIVLPSGVRLLVIPMSGVNSVATSVMVGVGSRYEAEGIGGISHFLEHMVFKGTKKYPTTDEVNVIERQGGLQNAYTDVDITNYHNKVLYSDWELGLEINKELALHPLLDQKHVDKERDVILEEMKQYEDEPSAKVNELFHALMYPGQALGRKIIGTEKSLRSVAAKELQAYHDRWYQPQNITVVLAGRINQSSELRDLSSVLGKVEEWFGKLERGAKSEELGKHHEFDKAKDIETGGKVVVVTKKETQQAYLELGVSTFDRRNDHRFAWSVFNLLMGVSFTSRLFREIREKQGLCYHIRSSSSNWADVGYWSIHAGVAPEKLEFATQAIVTELKKVVESGVNEDEVAVAKKRLQTMIAFKSEDPEFLNEYYGRQEVFNNPILTLEDYLEKIGEVDARQINTLVRNYITDKTLNMAVVWNKEGGEELGEKLKL